MCLRVLVCSTCMHVGVHAVTILQADGNSASVEIDLTGDDGNTPAVSTPAPAAPAAPAAAAVTSIPREPSLDKDSVDKVPADRATRLRALVDKSITDHYNTANKNFPAAAPSLSQVKTATSFVLVRVRRLIMSLRAGCAAVVVCDAVAVLDKLDKEPSR
jgi:hypothetical protein